ncbi:MAG: hypothetical protein JXC32_03525, partial [Anaerolineae bacterium]|nr:hypothetical protein [Anaerolineae bacterium]
PPIEHPVWPAFWRSLGAATGAIAIAAALVGLSTFYTGRARRDDYVTIAEILRCHRHPTDAVLLYVDRDWPIFAAHYAGPRHDLPYGASLSDPATVETTLAPIWETASAVWLVSTPESLQADPLQAVPQWLATRSAVARTLVDGENTLTLYTRSELDDRVRETILPGTTLPTRIATAHSLVGAHLPLPRYRTGDIVHLGLYWIPPVPANVQVTVDNGTSRVQYEVAPPSADRNIARSQVDIPLTADLSGGSYAITVDVPGYAPALVGEPTLVGTFRLIASTVEAPGVVAATSISHRTDVRFAAPNGGSPGGLTPVGFIELVGYDLPKATVAPGEAVALTLYWRTETPLTERYKVFTHLLGETFNAGSGNFLWGQQDNEPGNGQALTTLWPSDTIIADSYRIPVDPQAPPGSYTVEIGMYGLVNGVRLHATARGLVVADDAVLLARVVVQ